MSIPDSPSGDNFPVLHPSTPKRSLRLAAGKENRLRRWAASTAAQWFAPPYLPGTLVLFAVIVALSAGFFLLMQQPPEYWTAGIISMPVSPDLSGLLSSGPLVFVAILLGYLLVLTLALLVLNRGVALAVWFIANLCHLSLIAGMSSICGFRGIYEVETIQSCANVRLFILSALALVFGLALSGALAVLRAEAADPPALRLPGSLAAALALALAGLVFVAFGTVRHATALQLTWRPVQSAHTPPGRFTPGLAYDTRLKQAVLFGGASRGDENGNWIGMNDTWVWDGQDWTEQRLSTSPPPRLDPAMAYDPKRGVVVLFGGHNQAVGLDDTWEWDGAQWVERHPQQRLQKRCCTRMIYDPARQKIVLFSGYAPNRTPPMMANTFYSDAWEYDGQTWTEITVDGIHATTNYTFVENPFQGGLLIVTSEGVWSWSGSHMRLDNEDITPAGRYDPGLAFDPLRRAIFLYGGITNDVENNETWRYDGSAWQRLYPARSPDIPKAPFHSRALYFDQVRQQVMLFTSRFNPSMGAFTAETWGLSLP